MEPKAKTNQLSHTNSRSSLVGNKSSRVRSQRQSRSQKIPSKTMKMKSQALLALVPVLLSLR